MTAPAKPLCRRGTSNGNATGNAASRRRRKLRMLAPYGGHGGTGETVPCYRCRKDLTYATLTVDRIVAGLDGGTYAWPNVRPACSECNIYTGNMLRDHRRKFPKGRPVVFITNRKFAAQEQVRYDIIDGESEVVLTVRNRVTGRIQRNVQRTRLYAVSAPEERAA